MTETIPKTMMAVQFDQHGGTEKLTWREADTPVPSSDEVLIRVRAAALNGFDPMMLSGETGLKTPFPMQPCGDFAGEIVSLGSGVQGWSIGDRVNPYPILPVKGMMGETTPGAAAEYVCVPASVLIKMPDEISFEDAAAMPVAYGTALRMIETRGNVKEGEKVLVLGAGGGVGVASIQFAKARGAYVIGAASGAHKLQALSDIGADETLDTSNREWRKELVSRHGKPAFYGEPGGMDVIINYVGGPTWVDSLKCLRNEGRILVCGASAGHDPQEDLRYIWSFEQSIVGSNGWSMDDQAELLDRVAKRLFKPVIHSTRPASDIAASFDELINRQVIGKQVVTL
ncbi:MAG: zinc-binding dehydrogenase [Pseudomonadota bacterium]